MTVRKYVLMDLIVLNLMFLITEFLSKYFYVRMDSKIYFSLGLLIQGILIYRWKSIGILSNWITTIVLSIMLVIFLKETLLFNLLNYTIKSLFSIVIITIYNFLTNENKLLKTLLMYIFLFVLNNLADSVVKAILFKENFLNLFKGFNFEHSLTLFATFILILLLNKHQNLFTNQYDKIIKQKNEHDNT